MESTEEDGCSGIIKKIAYAVVGSFVAAAVGALIHDGFPWFDENVLGLLFDNPEGWTLTIVGYGLIVGCPLIAASIFASLWIGDLKDKMTAKYRKKQTKRR